MPRNSTSSQRNGREPPQVWRERVTNEFSKHGRCFNVSTTCRLNWSEQRIHYDYAIVEDFLTWQGKGAPYRSFKVQPGSVVFAFPDDDNQQNPYIALVLDIYKPLAKADGEDEDEEEEEEDGDGEGEEGDEEGDGQGSKDVLVECVWLYRLPEMNKRAKEGLRQAGMPKCYIATKQDEKRERRKGLPFKYTRMQHLESGALNEVFLSFDPTTFSIDQVMDTVTVHFLPEDAGFSVLQCAMKDAAGRTRPAYIPGFVCRYIYDHVAYKLHFLDEEWKGMVTDPPEGMREMMLKLMAESKLKRVHWRRMRRGEPEAKEMLQLEHMKGLLPSEAEKLMTEPPQEKETPAKRPRLELTDDDDDELPLQVVALKSSQASSEQPSNSTASKTKTTATSATPTGKQTAHDKKEQQPQKTGQQDKEKEQKQKQQQKGQQQKKRAEPSSGEKQDGAAGEEAAPGDEQGEESKRPIAPPVHDILVALATCAACDAWVTEDGCVDSSMAAVRPQERRGDADGDPGWAVYVKEGSKERLVSRQPGVPEVVEALPTLIATGAS